MQLGQHVRLPRKVKVLILLFLGALTSPVLAESDEIMNRQDERVVMGKKAVVATGESVKKLMVIAGEAEIAGQVDQLVVIGGDAFILSGGKVSEELVVIGGQLHRDPTAVISGRTTELTVPLGEDVWEMLRRKLYDQHFAWLNKKSTWLAFAVLKIFVLFIFFQVGEFLSPAYQDRLREVLAQSPLKSGLWALLTVVLVLPTTVFLTLSIIGIPLLPLQFSLLVMFGMYGYIQVAQWLVHRLPGTLNWKLSWVTLLGLITLEMTKMIPYGNLAVGLLTLVGFGAASQVFYQMIWEGRRRSHHG